MARTQVFTFAPGSMESLTLRVWTVRVANGSRRVAARLAGTFTVYGEFGEETVRVDTREDRWASERDAEFFLAARTGDAQAADELAALLLEYALEDWEVAR